MEKTTYIPYKKLLLGFLLSCLTLYLKTPIFLIAYVLISSYIISLNNDILKCIFFFFILSFMLPYGFVAYSTKGNIGNYINEYVIAGIPLYLFIPNTLRTKTFIYFTKTQKSIFILSVIILLMSNVLPGIASLIGIGGHHVRIIFVLNFINALIIFYYMTHVVIDKKFIQYFTGILIFFGLILSITGIFQYFTQISIIPNYNPSNWEFTRLYVISSRDSVACIPFLIIPFIFILSKIFKEDLKFSNLIVIFFIILTSMILTWTRWAYLTIVMIILIATIVSKKRISKFFRIIFLIAIFSPVFINLYNDALINRDQAKRISKTGSLSTRVYLWGLGATAIADGPIFGYGFGNQVNAMFSKESSFLLMDEHSTNSVDTFHQQSVHQYIIDNMLALGVFFIIPFSLMIFYILKHSYRLLKLQDPLYGSFYLAIFLTTVGLFIFWIQNVGAQSFLYYSFLGLLNRRNIHNQKIDYK